MLQEAKDLQNSAVTKLVNILSGDKKELTFKAPTGSGKTYMMSDFMNRILSESDDFVFIVSTLSKGNLAEQNFESFNALNENNTFPKINPYLINSDSTGEGSLFIPTDYNVYVLPRDLYKQKSKLKEEGTFLNFLKTLIFPINSELKQKKIILIKDECHIATKNLDELNDYFYKIINFSATPKLSRRQIPDVEITNEEAEAVKIIKRIDEGNENDSLDVCLEKFEEIKSNYNNLLAVNPCLIIQISNSEKAEEELDNNIFPALSKHQDLKWVYITGYDKTCKSNDSGFQKLPVSKWKKYMKEKESSISVIIFKMVISEGWDIPRACMLYQIRDSKSKQLDEQVMGRVRRNPRLLDYDSLSEEAQNLAMTAWIWGIIPKDEHAAKEVSLVRNFEIEKSIRIKPTKLQNINAVKSFDVDSFIQSLGEQKINPPSIFDSYQKLIKQDNEIQKLCYEYSDSYSKWNLFTENLSNIKTTFEAFLCDYEKSMVTCNEVSFPYESCFVENDKSLTLDDWVWYRKDDSNDFSFDSEAEWKWAQILKDIRSESIEK
ncbi:MAG: DEAD/DEAH box helicase family protein, partial [Treponema sp.]|nr:DEAD/DEAH box helicase family protein [Treponema sp.]